MSVKIKKRCFGFGIILLSLLCLEFISKQIDLEYNYYQSNFDLSPEYEHFYHKDDFAYLKVAYRGTLKTKPFQINKSNNQLRGIFLGGSSVYNLELSYLREVLEKKLLGKSVELINMGGNSYGTNRISLLLKEALRYSPDFIVLYTGHNEFEEKFISEKFKVKTPFKKLDLFLTKNLHSYRLMSYSLNSFFAGIGQYIVEKSNVGERPFFLPQKRVEWGIQLDKDIVYYNYRLNLELIIDELKEREIPLVLSTVAYNRDVPPFKEGRAGYSECFDTLELKEKINCLEFYLELDIEPHRASKRSNQIVKELARGSGISFFDLDAYLRREILKTNSSYHKYFYDHCHLSKEANIELLEEKIEPLIYAILLEK